MSTTPRFSIILPVYDQAAQLGALVRGHQRALEKLPDPHETLVVVNGPHVEESLAVGRELEDEIEGVRFMSCEGKGWGLAVKTGIAAARGEILCYTNSARTSPEDLVLHLLYARVFPDVVVKANRKDRDGALRRLGSLLYNIECRMLFDLPYLDINGTPKVFPRSFTELSKLRRDDDLIDLEFNVRCRREGYKLLEVPIFSSRRMGGRSATGWRAALGLYLGVLALWHQMRRGRP